MNGIVINIDPIILRLGHFELRWYSVILGLAVLVAIWLAVREGKRKGVAPEEIYSLVPWVLISGVVGARLFHVIDLWDYYASNPLQMVWLQQGGLAIWGALVGGGIAIVAYARLRHLPLGRLIDVAVPAVLVAQIVGRFACIINGDAYGGVTDLPWGFIYVHPDALIPSRLAGVPTHPYPVYEIIWNGLVLLLILRLRRHFTTDGLLFFVYMSSYGLGRFVLTFVREEKVWFWGLQEAQILGLVIMIASLAMFAYLFRKERRDLPAT